MSDFADHFSRIASDYAQHRPTYPPAVLDFLAAQSPAHDLAWDCGCGSGQLSVLLATRFTRVVATDASAAQIASATAHPHVEYRIARAEASGLPPSSADLAVAAQAAHWFDLERYYDEVRRVARPGALVALVAYGHAATGVTAIDDVLEGFHSRLLRTYWPRERAHIDDGYRHLPFPFTLVPAPAALVIERNWTLGQFLDYIRTWSAWRALEAAGGSATIADFEAAMAAAWGTKSAQRQLRWPLIVRAGRV